MGIAPYRQKVVELAILVNNLLALGAANTAGGVNQLGHRTGNRISLMGIAESTKKTGPSFERLDARVQQ